MAQGIKIEAVSERLRLGEGPHWDVKNKCLYFVDIFGQAIHKYVPERNLHTKAKIGKYYFCLYSFQIKHVFTLRQIF